MTFEEEKMPKKNLGRVATKFVKATEERPDEGENVEVYRKALKEIEVLKFISDLKKKICEEVKEAGMANEVPQVEFVRLTTKMFPKWKTQDTKIARFMQNLDPKKIYSETEMRQYAKEKGMKNIGQVQSINVGTNGFGTIMKKSGTTFQLYPELVPAFEKYF